MFAVAAHGNCQEDLTNAAFSGSQLLDFCTERTAKCRPVRVGEDNALARQHPALARLARASLSGS